MWSQCERGVVGSGRGRGRRRGPVRAVRPAVQQRVQPAPARAADPRGAAGGLRDVRPQLQDAAVPPPAHAGAAPRAPRQASASPRAAARAPRAAPTLPTVAGCPRPPPLSVTDPELQCTLLPHLPIDRHRSMTTCSFSTLVGFAFISDGY